MYEQGCALAEPDIPGTHLLLSGDEKILVFSYKSYAGFPRVPGIKLSSIIQR